jgi:hypothetical protein
MSRNGVCFVISPIGDAQADARGDAKDILATLIVPGAGAGQEKYRAANDFEYLVKPNDEPAGVGAGTGANVAGG